MTIIEFARSGGPLLNSDELCCKNMATPYGHDTRICGKFLEVHMTHVSDIFWTWYASIIGVSILHRQWEAQYRWRGHPFILTNLSLALSYLANENPSLGVWSLVSLICYLVLVCPLRYLLFLSFFFFFSMVWWCGALIFLLGCLFFRDVWVPLVSGLILPQGCILFSESPATLVLLVLSI